MKEIAPGLACLTTGFVNCYFVGEPLAPWTLVDTGLPGFAGKVRAAALKRFRRKPRAIVLTHGHIDHAGNALALAREWHVPIYCGRKELPYLTARSDYPPQDPTVGGFLGLVSRVLPSSALDLRPHVRELPDGELPELPDWRMIPTPGHSPGHVSFFRESDRALLAGDALATADMDSWSGALTNEQQLWRAGTPFTCDWKEAWDSARALAGLRPAVIAAGHGRPMHGTNLAAALEHFAAAFPIPSHGRYVREPAQTDETGVVHLPPAPFDFLPPIAGALAVGALVGHLVGGKRGRWA